MDFKRLALTGAAAALPLSVLVGAPAAASDEGHDYGRNEDPKVKVRVHDRKVRVEYKCFTEQKHDHGDDYDGKDDDDKEVVKYGTLTIKFRYDSSKKSVKCDGEKHEKNFYLKGHKGGKVVVILTDSDGDKAYDDARAKNKKYDDDKKKRS